MNLILFFYKFNFYKIKKMKSFAILMLLGVASTAKVSQLSSHDSVWDNMMEGVSDADAYNQSTPKDYKPAEKVVPKIDYQAMYKKQRAEEEK